MALTDEAKWFSNKHNVIVPTPIHRSRPHSRAVNLYRNTKANLLWLTAVIASPAMAKYARKNRTIYS